MYILLEAALWTPTGRLAIFWAILTTVVIVVLALTGRYSAPEMGLTRPTVTGSLWIIGIGMGLAALIPALAALTHANVGPSHVLPWRTAWQYALWASLRGLYVPPAGSPNRKGRRGVAKTAKRQTWPIPSRSRPSNSVKMTARNVRVTYLAESPSQSAVNVSQADLAVRPWARVLVPSVADLIFVAVLAAVSCSRLATRLLGDAGIGWHIRNGELMLRTHSITRTDPFSARMSGQPWYAWEWMYDAIVAAIHEKMGLNGVVFLAAILIAATFALLLHWLLRRGALLPLAVAFLVLSMTASSIHFFARPHVVSWLFTLIWFEILDSAEQARDRESIRRLFWLPLLMLLWVNLHGGFVLGLVLLGLYLLSGMVAYYRGAGEERSLAAVWLRKLGLVAVLSLLSSLVNPYGYKLHAHVYRYLSDRWLMNHIDEFLPPNFHGMAQQCFGALLLITIVTLAFARQRPRLSHLLVIIVAAYTGLYASRNLPVSSTLLALLVAPMLSEVMIGASADPETPQRMRNFLLRCHAFASRTGGLEADFRGHLWPIAAAVLGAVVCLHQGKLGPWQLMNAHFDAKRFPVQAADVIAQRGIREPIFTPDSWGGYLIYRLYPQTKVLVDDRHDLYGDQFLKEYLKTIRAEPGWDRMLNQRQVDWILVPRESPLANALTETKQWRVAYGDSTATLFARTSQTF